jgi:hypothetical protein
VLGHKLLCVHEQGEVKEKQKMLLERVDGEEEKERENEDFDFMGLNMRFDMNLG